MKQQRCLKKFNKSAGSKLFLTCMIFWFTFFAASHNSLFAQEEEVFTPEDAFEEIFEDGEDPFADLQEPEIGIEEELEWLQAETYVITASKVLENIKKTSASVSVITAREIRRMGAREIKDVLRTVPGISFQNERHGDYDLEVRGIVKDGNQHILFLLNGHSLNANYWGGIAPTYTELALENIERIEVVRGPGSALYGANAFAAIVNVITKEAADVDGLQLNAKAGSEDTQQYNLLFGKRFGELGVKLNFEYLETDIYRGKIQEDQQSQLDQIFGSQASLAPGETRGYKERYEFSWLFELYGFRFDGIYADRDMIPSIGLTPVLNDKSRTPSTDYAFNIRYDRDVMQNLNLQGKIYYNYAFMDYYYQLYPENTVLMTPDGPQVWPEGVIGAPSNKNIRTGGEVQATYSVSDSHTLLGGVTYEYMNQYDVEALSNYLTTPIRDVLIARGEVSEVSDIQNYSQEADRTFGAVFLEDLWNLGENLRFTLGARYDEYSDFGGSFNPRAGLVWEFIKDYDFKLLYGRAFRAPSFYELYNVNNPAYVGNPDLNPEIVDTYEMSFGAQVSSALSGRLTLFRNHIDDSIELVSYETQNVFENQGEIRAQGIELEMRYDFGKGTYLGMNYTYQDAENLDDDEELYNAPDHKGNVMANVRFSKYVNWYVEWCFQEGFTRQKDDSRDYDNPGFGVCNTTLLLRKFLPKLEDFEIRGSLYNIFDEDYTVPTAKDGLPVDYPMPGRQFLVDLQYAF